jgi:hypothetical protein
VDRQRALIEWPRAGELALDLKQRGEEAEVPHYFGMLGAECLLLDHQRALTERPRSRKIALGFKQSGEVSEVPRYFGMSEPSTFSPIASARS